MAATLYQPINVYKPVAPDIGIVDGPFEYLTSAGIRMPMPFTTRMRFLADYSAVIESRMGRLLRMTVYTSCIYSPGIGR